MGRVLFVACTNVGEGMIEEIMTNPEIKNTEIVGVVNINPTVGLNKANYHTYLGICNRFNIPLHYCNNINDEETVQWMVDKKPDIIIQTGWSQKFKNEVLNVPKYCCIGEHPAPLPKGRGAACINWAILTGEKQWGDTFFQMVEEYDKGVIYSQEFFDIEEYDNVKTIYDKVEAVSRIAIRKNIDLWSNGVLNGKVQTNEGATYYHRRRPTDGEFKFEDFTTRDLHNFIRAQTYPYPGAFFNFNGNIIKVLSTEITDQKSNKKPGTILHIIPEKGAVDFVCSDGGVIRFLRIKPDNMPEMWASDYFK